MSFIGTQLFIPLFRVLSGIRYIVLWAKGNYLFGCICNQTTVTWTSPCISVLAGYSFILQMCRQTKELLWYSMRGSWSWKRSLRSWSLTINKASPCSPLNPKLLCYRDPGLSLCVSGTSGNSDSPCPHSNIPVFISRAVLQGAQLKELSVTEFSRAVWDELIKHPQSTIQRELTGEAWGGDIFIHQRGVKWVWKTFLM